MPTNILLAPTLMPGKTDLSSSAVTLDLSIKSSSSSTKLSKSPDRQMSSATITTAVQKSLASSKVPTPTTDPGGDSSSLDSDEVKVFGCEKHEEDVDIDGDANSDDRLSPVIKDEETSPPQASSTSLADRLNSEHQFQSFFPYFISPYYHAAAVGSATPPFDKMAPLGSLSKFMSPPPAHISSANLGIDPSTGVPNSMYPLSSPSSFQSLYAQHWRSPMFPFVFPPGYPFSPAILSQGSSASHTPSGHSPTITNHGHNPVSQKRSSTHRRSMDNSPHHHHHHKLSMSLDVPKPKKPHIKKPLNAFMLFMKEQRAQVVQECTLRESAAINQILGRKWHELDRNVQQKYYDMARDERMKHMQLHPGWSARDNYGARKKRGSKGKKREKNQGENGECLNQKKCRARFGLDQQSNWCKHCKRKKKCLRYTEDETVSAGPNSVGDGSWSEDDDTDNMNDSEDGMEHCDIPMMEHPEGGNMHDVNRGNRSPHHVGLSVDSDEENKSRLLMHQQPPNSNGSGSSTSTNGAVPMSMITGATTATTNRKDSSSSSSSPQGSFLHLSHHHRYPIAPPPPPPHFPPHAHHHHHHYPYFDSFLQPSPTPLLNGLKRET